MNYQQKFLSKIAIATCVAGVVAPLLIWALVDILAPSTTAQDERRLMVFAFVACETVALVSGALAWGTSVGKAAAVIAGLLLVGVLVLTA